MPLKPTISPTQAVNNMKYGELGSTTDYNIAAAGFVERDIQEEHRVVPEVKQKRTERGHTITKKCLEEIFSTTPIICRSERHNKRVSRLTRSNWENREPTSSSAICSGVQGNSAIEAIIQRIQEMEKWEEDTFRKMVQVQVDASDEATR
ncbi:hypothetical protein Ancab_015188 [Ancistrocladus abbreviatus]